MLVAKNLLKVYGIGDAAVCALNDVSLEVAQQDLLAVMGASGSGKSTLLHILSTLDAPTKGEVIWKDVDLHQLNNSQKAKLRRRHFGFVFQFFNLVPTLTVRENIVLPILMDSKNPNEEYISHLIEMLGLHNKVSTLPSKLSGGQQQRVAIGRALAAKPEIIFADEPTGNLDSKTGRGIIKLFKETAATFGQTLIIVTHDQSVADECSRVVELLDGIVVSDTRENEQ